jgi:ribosomal protein S18 acetylase RimI-like enzyme
VGNDGAKLFYERLGFRATETIDGYYAKMEPRGAVFMVCEDIAAALGDKANGSA